MRRRGWARVAALALLATVACGGGGGGGGGGPAPPTTPQPSMTFTGSSVTAPAVVLARGAGSTASVLELEVRSDELADVYGLAFDLEFPGGILRYEGGTEGAFLASGGAGTSWQVAETATGRLVVGISRLGTVGGTSGSGLLMTLRFTATGSGTGSFGFSANRAFDPQGGEIDGVSWGGGTIQVTR